MGSTLWDSLAGDLGFAGLMVPEICGGSGLGAVEMALVLEEKGRALAVVPFFETAVLGAQALLLAGSGAKTGPFGTTIAHGYLTLSLANLFLPQILGVRGFSAGVNVGVDKLRFLAPVPVGSRIRGKGQILKVETVKAGAIQSVVRMTIEIEGKDKPACVVDKISRYFLE